MSEVQKKLSIQNLFFIYWYRGLSYPLNKTVFLNKILKTIFKFLFFQIFYPIQVKKIFLEFALSKYWLVKQMQLRCFLEQKKMNELSWALYSRNSKIILLFTENYQYQIDFMGRLVNNKKMKESIFCVFLLLGIATANIYIPIEDLEVPTPTSLKVENQNQHYLKTNIAAYEYHGEVTLNIQDDLSDGMEYYITFFPWEEDCEFKKCYYGFVNNYTSKNEET